MKNFFDLSEWRESVKKVAKTKNLGFKIVKKNMYFYLHVGLDQTAHQGNPQQAKFHLAVYLLLWYP